MKKKKLQNKPKKQAALLYCRVSSDRQVNDGHGLESQEHRCKEYAKQHGYIVENIFRDSYTGGGDFMKRPAMSEMVTYIENKPSTNYVVIFDDTKRLARDHMEYWRLRQLFKSLEATVESPNFTFGDSEESWLQEAITAVFSDFERRSNKRQVNQKMRARLESGYWTFNSDVPGYIRKNLPDKTWILARHEPKASLIKEALEGFANDRFDTKTDLQIFLQRSNYLAENKQKRVYLSRVDRLLERASMYAGYIEYPDWDVERRPGKHEAIISDKTLQQIEDKLQNKKRVRIRQDYSEDFPLRPYVACAGCGKKLTASWTRGRSGNYHPYYRCTNNSKVCPFGNKSIPKEKLEGDFRDLLQTLKPTDGLVDLTKAILKDLYEKKNAEFKDATKKVDREVKRLEIEIEKTTQRAINTKDELMAERYEIAVVNLIGQLNALTSQSGAGQFDVSFGTAADEVMDMLNNPRNKWDSGSLDEKGLVIRLVFDGDPAYNKNCGFGTAELSAVIKLFERIRTTNSRDVEMTRIELVSESGTTL
jgi:site-specific DNA recombinase